jgi:hypothetical protein
MKIMKENPGHTERYIGRLAPPKLLLEMLNAFKTLITEQAPPPHALPRWSRMMKG